MPSAYSKGDRVEFDHNNETLYGVVTRGGARPKVIRDGGKVEFTVPAPLLRDSTFPLPKDKPHAMDSWSLKSYVANMGESDETTAFTAIVLEDGTPTLAAKNDGRGGCNVYYPLSGGYSSVNRFEEAAKQWLIDNGMPQEKCSEAGDMWLTWKATQAPYGVTAEAMVEYWNEAMDSYRNDSPAFA